MIMRSGAMVKNRRTSLEAVAHGGHMVEYGGSRVEEWWWLNRLSTVDTRDTTVFRFFSLWLMRHNTNTHNYTLFTTF